jgi:molybdate transport system substrate-binding protein
MMTARSGWAAALMVVLAAACGGRSGGSAGAERVRGTITVLAAASLQEPFTALGRRFEDQHAGTTVRFSFDASSTLARQVEAGAPADVLATADQPSMVPVAEAGLVSTPAVFARNRLAILVARGNPEGVVGLADLDRPGLDVVLCAPEVPCGRLAGEVLDRAGVTVQPRSLDPNVKGVMTKVTLGEADAGIVYATDVRAAAGKADGIEIPPAQNVVARCPVATVRAAPNPAAAARFVELVRSEEGRRVLAGAGFET